jgi:DNA-binding PadR family transcriptional regulator
LRILSIMDISGVDKSDQGDASVSPSTDPRTIPLRPPVYHILLALVGRDRHGLGIADEIERASEGALELGPGTLYRSLAEMTAARLIRAVPAPSEDADPRRKYYRITSEGRDLLARETVRLGRLVETARASGAVPEKA